MNDPVKRALSHVRDQSGPEEGILSYPITLNFHPDLITVEGRTVIERIAETSTYQSQFETGTSSGGLGAVPGGKRWNWESRIFGGAYDNTPASMRPKYGALNYQNSPVGGAPRFGSCHLRCAAHVSLRASFCYPDSHLEPCNFAVGNVKPLITLAENNEDCLDPFLDNYIEAHVHGPLTIGKDVEAIVLDPSFAGTVIEEAARSLACHIEWHDGFSLGSDIVSDCASFRGPSAASAIVQLLENGPLTPAAIWHARHAALDYQTAKWVWHCMARYGTGAKARRTV